MLGGERPDRVKLVNVDGPVSLLGLPSSHGLFRAQEALKEHGGRIDEADNAPLAKRERDVEIPVAIVNFGCSLHERRAIQFSATHTQSSPHSESAEQRARWPFVPDGAMNSLTYVGLTADIPGNA